MLFLFYHNTIVIILRIILAFYLYAHFIILSTHI